MIPVHGDSSERGTVMGSILVSIKKMLGIEECYDHFDAELIMHINSVLFILTQMGVGPPEGFSIRDANTEWKDFLTDISKLESVKTYIYLKVKLIFDPPSSSAVMEATNRMISELEWRLFVATDPVETTEKEGDTNESE